MTLTGSVVFFPNFNGTISFNHFPIQGEIHLDASLQGLGAYFCNEVYAVSVPKGNLQMDIIQLEILNILLVIRVWGAKWSGKNHYIVTIKQWSLLLIEARPGMPFWQLLEEIFARNWQNMTSD